VYRLILLLSLLLIVVPAVAQGTVQEDCILIIGDSIPAGQAVTQVPGYGYPVIVGEPFTNVLDTLYNQLRLTHIGIYNLSVGASSLGAGGDVRYVNTPQYAYLLSKRCQFAVIFPWINDLPETSDAAAMDAHIQQLAQLADSIHQSSPFTRVVVLDYYRVVVTELGQRVYGNTITPPVIGAMNQAMTAACASGGALGSRINVSCLHIEPFLFPLDDVLIQSITQAQFTAENFRAYDAQGQGWLNEYWLNNPGIAIPVDGVHLNRIGKQRLAQALHNYLQALNPAAFQTVASF